MECLALLPYIIVVNVLVILISKVTLCKLIGVCSRKIQYPTSLGFVEYYQYYCCDNHEKRNDKCKECPNGFISVNEEPCMQCPSGSFGDKCTSKCDCSLHQRCDSLKGCITIEPTDTTATLITTDLTNENQTTSAAHISTSDEKQNNPSATSSNEVTEGTIVTGVDVEVLLSRTIVISIFTSTAVCLLVILSAVVLSVRRKIPCFKNIRRNSEQFPVVLEENQYDEITDDSSETQTNTINSLALSYVKDEVPARDNDNIYLTPCLSLGSSSNSVKSALPVYQNVLENVSTTTSRLQHCMNHNIEPVKTVMYINNAKDQTYCKTMESNDDIVNRKNSELISDTKRFSTM